MSVTEILHQSFPSLDSEIIQYINGILQSPEDFGSSEELFDAVGGMILEAGEGAVEETVREICRRLYHVMQGDSQSGGEDRRLLDAPVNLGEKVKTTVGGEIDSIWLKSADYRNSVDQRKLDRVDAKLKQKQEKRAQKEMSSASASKGPLLSGPTTSQSSNRLLDRAEAQGGMTYDIKIENIDIAYGHRVLLTGADLSLSFGRRYGLVGRNGTGKTTLLRSIANRELRIASHLTILHVEQEVEGNETTVLQSVLECDGEREELIRREKELLAKGTELASEEESDLAKIYARLEELEADKVPAKAAAILAGLGFTSEAQALPTKQFSGGWRMRLALARALFTKPDLLLLDEPTNMLDMRAVLWLESYLVTWPSTLLVVSHDRKFLTSVCSDIIHLHSQRLEFYKGNYEVFVRTKTEKLKNQQREYDAQMQYRQHLQEFIDRWRYNAKRASLAQSKIKILEKLPELKPVVAEPEVILRFPAVDKLSPPVLQLSEVSFGYEKHQVFQNMNISADMDSRIALVGENGTGKSTLVKLLTGELSPQEGYRQAHRSLRVAYFSQHHVDQLVMDISALELMQQRFPGKKDEEYRHLMGLFGVSGELPLRPIASLSGGQKSRLAFALMAVPMPNFLIFDEPTNHLDVETVDALAKALNRFPGGVVLVSHDEHLINMACSEVWLCKDQTVYRLEGGLEQYKRTIEAEFQMA